MSYSELPLNEIRATKLLERLSQTKSPDMQTDLLAMLEAIVNRIERIEQQTVIEMPRLWRG